MTTTISIADELEQLEGQAVQLLRRVTCPKCQDIYDDPRVFQCVCLSWCLRCFKRHAAVRPGDEANYAFIHCPQCRALTTWTHSFNKPQKSLSRHPASAPLPPTAIADAVPATTPGVTAAAAAAAAVDIVAELFRDLDLCTLVADYKSLCVQLCTRAWSNNIQLLAHSRTNDRATTTARRRDAPPPRPLSTAPSHRPPLLDEHQHHDSDGTSSSSDSESAKLSDRLDTPDLLSELDSILEDLDATGDMLAAQTKLDQAPEPPHPNLLPRPKAPPPPLTPTTTTKLKPLTGGKKITSILNLSETPER